ncbi:MAG TPA: EutN/CcmL family microcompartment protein [Gemmatimonadota bacterium]|jgi:microcompartment protein CcmK/EutM|nr:EutN/CcmL family microcompartment protein [Gemmatimonadota bacterium]
MKMGRVVGSVVATRKDEKLEGLKLLLVRDLDVDLAPEKGYAVAVDAVGAGAGEVVLYATGSSARQTGLTDGRPVDAVIMAIVDEYDVGAGVVRT